MRIVDDFINDLAPVNDTRKCDKCGAWTWWAGTKQRTLGRCWECVPGLSLAICTDAQFDRALALLTDAFPGSVLTDAQPRRYRPDTYVGPDAGPCVSCRRQVRRYGPHAHPFCLDCRPRERRNH